MHETDIFTSQGHWELISRWLESSGKWKPLSKHLIVFFLWMRSWKWSQWGAVWGEAWGCSEAGRSPALQHRACPPGWAQQSLPDPIFQVIFLGCLSTGTFNELSPCLEHLATLLVSQWSRSSTSDHEITWFGWAQEWSPRARPRSRADLGQWFLFPAPQPIPVFGSGTSLARCVTTPRGFILWGCARFSFKAG